METIKRNINTIAGFIAIVLTIINVVINKLGYMYRPHNYTLFFILYLVLTSGVTIISVINRNNASKISKTVGSFMPIISITYIVTFIFCFDLITDNGDDNILYCELLFAIITITSLVIFFVYNKIALLKLCVVILTSIFAILFSLVLFISIIFANFGENTIVQTVSSPDNSYLAFVVSSDQGALGGSTKVYVRNIKKEVNFISGIFKTETKELWSGRWAENPALKWKDNDTIFIKDIAYDVIKF